jgi:hypothetical protein
VDQAKGCRWNRCGKPAKKDTYLRWIGVFC